MTRANRRTKDEESYHSVLISRLAMQYNSPAQIRHQLAEQHSVQLTTKQVNTTMRKIRESWVGEIVDNYDKLIHEELARLDALEASIWDDLRTRAETDKQVQRVIEEVMQYDDIGDALGLAIKKVRTTESDLEPPYQLYNLVIKVQQERRKILGIYAPTRIGVQMGHTIHVKGYETVSPDDWPVAPPADPPAMIEGEVIGDAN